MTDISKNASLEQHRASQEWLGIGKLIEGERHRDAIHVAIVPVDAGERLYAGQHVGVEDGVAWFHKVGLDPIGIVDPFFDGAIQPGQRFWLFLYPGTITSLRHVWTHPALADDSSAPATVVKDKATSEAWLRNFCASADCPDYDTLIGALDTGVIKDRDGSDDYFNVRWGDEYLHFGGVDAHGDIPPEFWDHVEAVLGRKIGPERRPNSFSCSC